MVDENDHDHILMEDKTLDLNSHISIPSYMEQCLDLKTGEIYYMNSTNGMRVKEDPRKLVSSKNADEFSGSVFSEEDSSYHESEESSSESSPSSGENQKEEDGLVVAGCKACFMYFMVPKFLEDCPKCASHLLHFGRSDHSASP
ncbi:hypothetical protein AALP_AA1G289300 [Arabis alpina]|uniref:WW domain-containing protein n=1 Tax=Arabis alpina TaxID=50452 RepID=A0A087HRC7_ARAAL|nr:hypothetical protein AALP_AA1G289300 [Arabis alpina]